MPMMLRIAVAANLAVIIATALGLIFIKNLSDLANIGQYLGSSASAMALIWLVYNQALMQSQIRTQQTMLETEIDQVKLGQDEAKRQIHDREVEGIYSMMTLYEKILLRHAASISSALVDGRLYQEDTIPSYSILADLCESNFLKNMLEQDDPPPSNLDAAATAAMYLKTYEKMKSEFFRHDETRELFILWSENSDFKRLALIIGASVNS